MERQYGLRTPDGDASLERADLAIGKLTRIASDWLFEVCLPV
jgi:hypothetical protein